MEKQLFEAVLDVLDKTQAMALKVWLANVLNEQGLSAEGRMNITQAHELIKLEDWTQAGNQIQK